MWDTDIVDSFIKVEGPEHGGMSVDFFKYYSTGTFERTIEDAYAPFGCPETQECHARQAQEIANGNTNLENCECSCMSGGMDNCFHDMSRRAFALIVTFQASRCRKHAN